MSASRIRVSSSPGADGCIDIFRSAVQEFGRLIDPNPRWIREGHENAVLFDHGSAERKDDMKSHQLHNDGKIATFDAVVDPVCGMKVTPSRAAGSADHSGHTYHFCSTSRDIAGA